MSAGAAAPRQSSPPIDISEIDARDVRTGGEWTRAQSLKNFGIALVVRTAFVVADRVPEPILLAFGRALGRLARRILGSQRRSALASASRCFDAAEATRIANESFERAGENLALSVLLRRPSVRASTFVSVSPESEAVLSRVLVRRQGAIFVTAHLGPFELVAARVAELGHPSAVVVRESYDPRLNAWVDAHRTGRGLEVIHRGGAGASFRIVRALRRGLAVGFLPDLATRGVATVEVDFLGARVGFPSGPQELALRLGAPVVVGALRPTSSDHGPRFELAIAELRIEPNTESVDRLTQRVAHALEEAISRSPATWLWMARADSDGKALAARAAGRQRRRRKSTASDCRLK